MDAGNQEEAAAEAVRSVSKEAKNDVVAAAIRAVPEGQQSDAAVAAVEAVPNEAKKDVVAAALRGATNSTKREVATEAVSSLSTKEQVELAERFLPDQPVTNRLWLIIVSTFAAVLVTATLALVAGVLVFEGVDAASIQVLLTVFTTVAGILAGFISGRTSSGGRSS